MGRIFKINEKIEIVCDSVGTRYGFRHDARLFVNGNETEKAKICYYNRTWESFEFQTVVLKLLEKTNRLTEIEKTNFKNSVNFQYR
jgi:hypothetical protein